MVLCQANFGKMPQALLTHYHSCAFITLFGCSVKKKYKICLNRFKNVSLCGLLPTLEGAGEILKMGKRVKQMSLTMGHWQVVELTEDQRNVRD